MVCGIINCHYEIRQDIKLKRFRGYFVKCHRPLRFTLLSDVGYQPLQHLSHVMHLIYLFHRDFKNCLSTRAIAGIYYWSHVSICWVFSLICAHVFFSFISLLIVVYCLPRWTLSACQRDFCSVSWLQKRVTLCLTRAQLIVLKLAGVERKNQVMREQRLTAGEEHTSHL